MICRFQIITNLKTKETRKIACRTSKFKHSFNLNLQLFNCFFLKFNSSYLIIVFYRADDFVEEIALLSSDSEELG